jgi:hypothetical protein
MAAFVLFVVAVAGGVVVADLVWENPAAGQITVFHHTVGGYPEGWLLSTAAGLGFVVALLLVASINSTKGRRARHKQLRGLRHGLEDRAAAPEPDHGRLLDAFFGPDEPSRHPGAPQPIQHPAEPLYQQVRSAHLPEEGREGRAEDDPRWIKGERVEYPPEPLYEQARRAAGLRQDRDLPVVAGQERRR